MEEEEEEAEEQRGDERNENKDGNKAVPGAIVQARSAREVGFTECKSRLRGLRPFPLSSGRCEKSRKRGSHRKRRES